MQAILPLIARTLLVSLVVESAARLPEPWQPSPALSDTSSHFRMSATERNIADTLVLSTTPERHIPQLGLGTYLSPPDRTLNSCLAAFKVGYRQVDTGQYYENEEEVGRAIKQSGIPREEIFVTTKILTAGTSVEENYESCLQSVNKLGGFVDCFLIHSPSPGPQRRGELWLALERLYQEGKAKSIGVSNFGIGQIEELKGVGNVWPPHVLQIEVSPPCVACVLRLLDPMVSSSLSHYPRDEQLHPWTQQTEVVQYCKSNGIVVQAYCPIVRNQKADEKHLVALAEKHGVSPNQILIRWSVQKGWVSLPKSDTPERIRSNADIYNFSLSNEDMEVLDGLDEGASGAIVMVVDNA